MHYTRVHISLTMYKVLLVTVLAVLVAGGVANPLRTDEYEPEDRETMYFPDSSGKLHLINLTSTNESLERASPKVVIFNLYTRANPEVPQALHMGDLNNLKMSNFNPANPTRFTVHGWMSAEDNPFTIKIRQTYLQEGDFNVIVVDWTDASNTINYISAKNSVVPTAEVVAKMIDYLVEATGISTKEIHLAGHSLGAHVVGVAGRKVESGQIHTIIGLDPALPLFSMKDSSNRISPDSAEYVEVIHTNGGGLSFLNPLGHADFYPNGGKQQPGCGIDIGGSCAHSRSFLYFEESLVSKKAFWSWNCLSYDELVKGTCRVINEMMPMGTLQGQTTNHNKARGIFLNKTYDKQPYAKGQPVGDSTVIKV